MTLLAHFPTSGTRDTAIGRLKYLGKSYGSDGNKVIFIEPLSLTEMLYLYRGMATLPVIRNVELSDLTQAKIRKLKLQEAGQ